MINSTFLEAEKKPIWESHDTAPIPAETPDWVKKAWIPIPASYYPLSLPWEDEKVIDCSPPGAALGFIDGPMQGQSYIPPPNPAGTIPWSSATGFYALRKEVWQIHNIKYKRKFYKFVDHGHFGGHTYTDGQIMESVSLSPGESVIPYNYVASKGTHLSFNFDMKGVDTKFLDTLYGENAYHDNPSPEEPALWEQI